MIFLLDQHNQGGGPELEGFRRECDAIALERLRGFTRKMKLARPRLGLSLKSVVITFSETYCVLFSGFRMDRVDFLGLIFLDSLLSEFRCEQGTAPLNQGNQVLFVQ